MGLELVCGQMTFVEFGQHLTMHAGGYNELLVNACLNRSRIKFYIISTLDYRMRRCH